jgi:polysaccharide biosynthesis protein PslH
MHILWVKVGGLWPLDRGGRLRSFHILSELAQSHRITVVTTHLPPQDGHEQSVALRRCEQVISIPHVPLKRTHPLFPLVLFRSWLSGVPVDMARWLIPELKREVECQLDRGNYDLCIADFLFAIPNIPLDTDTPVLLFTHNVESMIWKRLSDMEPRTWKRALLNIEWQKTCRYEADICRKVKLTVAVSGQDRAVLTTLAPGAAISEVPTGVDTVYFSPNGATRDQHHLVFTGSMDWFPNEDAVLYFLDSILPRIRQSVPHVTFTVVGRNPSTKLQEVAGRLQGVFVTGTVADVRPYMDAAAICVVPLRIGGGTRLKIFEALSMSKAVVSTRVGAEGLPIESGVHFLQAETAEDFARDVVTLLRDPVRRNSLGNAGRQLMQSRFSWSRVADEFECRCREAVQQYA